MFQALFRAPRIGKTHLKIQLEWCILVSSLSFFFNQRPVRYSFENHFRFKTITSKFHTLFQNITTQKTYTLGRHITLWLTLLGGAPLPVHSCNSTCVPTFLRQRSGNGPCVCRKRASRVCTDIFCNLKLLLLLVTLNSKHSVSFIVFYAHCNFARWGVIFCSSKTYSTVKIECLLGSIMGKFVDYNRNPC